MKHFFTKKWGRGIAVALVITMSVVMFAGCALFSSTGPRGAPGRDGETTVTSYWDYLNKIWTDNLMLYDKNGNQLGKVQTVYASKDQFLIMYPQEHLHQQGPQGPAGVGNAAQATNIALQSTVDIIARRSQTVNGVNTGVPSSTTFGQVGSGVIYKLDKSTGNGFIITNYHVISRYVGGNHGLVVANNVTIRLYGMSNYGNVINPNTGNTTSQERFELSPMDIPVKVIGGSAEHDIAILEMRGTTLMPGTGYGTVKGIVDAFPVEEARVQSGRIDGSGVVDGFRGEPAVGTPVLAIGNPLNMNMSVSDGIVSMQSEYIELEHLDEDLGWVENRVMRISAAINRGNSGGAVFNYAGELVGIVQARWYWENNNTKEIPVDGIAFAIPLDVALTVADQVLHERGDPNQSAPYDDIPSNPNAYNIIEMQRHEFNFKIKAANIKVELKNGVMVISEDVLVGKRSGSANSTLLENTQILSITINTKTYTITRAYQVDELMVAGFGKTVTINGVRNGSPVNVTLA